MKQRVELFQLTKFELQELLQERDRLLLEKFREILKEKEDEVELLSKKEALEFLKVSPNTLDSWVGKGFIKRYGIGSRVYFKKHELLGSLTEF